MSGNWSNWAETKELIRDATFIGRRPILFAWTAIGLVTAFYTMAGHYWLNWLSGFAFIFGLSMLLAWARKRALLNYITSAWTWFAKQHKCDEAAKLSEDERTAWMLDRLLRRTAELRVQVSVYREGERLASPPPRPAAGPLAAFLLSSEEHKPIWNGLIEETGKHAELCHAVVKLRFGEVADALLPGVGVPRSLRGMDALLGEYGEKLEALQQQTAFRPPETCASERSEQ